MNILIEIVNYIRVIALDRFLTLFKPVKILRFDPPESEKIEYYHGMVFLFGEILLRKYNWWTCLEDGETFDESYYTEILKNMLPWYLRWFVVVKWERTTDE